tara:strand:+ start:1084 stop:1374 length:291 start_codon:yes stop_codon:yes gene_type:complete
MSPTNKKRLNQIRKKLDQLDNKLISLIKVRKNLVDKVIKQKQHKKEIIDKERIKIILNRIKKKSINQGIDPKITNRIWKNMIWSFIDYEKKIFKKK